MRLTASALPRAAVCAGSVVLPQADTITEHSAAGTDNHAILESAVKQGRLEDLPVEIQALIPVGALAAAEIAVAYDVATDRARVLGQGLQRAYETGPTEIAGTIDLQIVDDGRRAIVVDYKRWEDVGPPDENEQTLFYGLATARLLGITEVTLVIAYVEQNEAEEMALAKPLVIRTIDEIDLDAFVQRLRWIVARVTEQSTRRVPDVRESKHCKWCSAFASCPAKTALIRRVMSGAEADGLEMMLPLDEETAAHAWVQVGQAKNLLSRVTRALYAFAKERPFKLPNGNIVGEHPTIGNETLDGDKVHEVVAEKHGKEVADKAVIYSATKKRLRDALRAAKVAGLGKAEEEVLIAVRQRGGADRKRSRDVEEYTPPKQIAGSK